MRLLLAEEDPITRKQLEALLGEWGHEVVATADGAAAWRALQSPEEPGLVLMDWSLPGLSGLEVCRKFHQVGKRLRTYLVIMTGRAAPEDRVRAFQAGADDYLVKPIEPAELRRRLQVAGRIRELQTELGPPLRELEGMVQEPDGRHCWLFTQSLPGCPG
jgi:DNA-binding response OmpR family regulator